MIRPRMIGGVLYSTYWKQNPQPRLEVLWNSLPIKSNFSAINTAAKVSTLVFGSCSLIWIEINLGYDIITFMVAKRLDITLLYSSSFQNKVHSLERDKTEAEAVKKEREALKKEAEASESVALEAYRLVEEAERQQQQEEEQAKEQQEAFEHFQLIDSNQDGKSVSKQCLIPSSGQSSSRPIGLGQFSFQNAL